MKRLFKNLIALACCMMCIPSAGAVDYSNESLHYDIVYQWGVIWKHAADATLSIRKTPSGYSSQLTGKTRSWADKVYPTRDTLKCTLNDKMQPLKYEKLTHEKKYYARDVVNFSYNYSTTTADCVRYRKDKEPATVQLTAKCQAYDMLSVFYMLRDIKFEAMSNNQTVSTVIFSGKKKEYLTIKYKGQEKVKMRNGEKRQGYRISFRFTQDGGKKSSEDMEAWISTDSTRVPLLLVGKLTVGEVKCYLREK